MLVVNMMKSLWGYRGFILGSVQREFQSRYRNSLLGAAWTILNPMAMILVYTVIFSQIMQARLPGVDSHFGYSVYLCAGILTWGLFSEIVGRCQNMLLDNANLLKKLNFPRLCLPVTITLTALLNFTIIFGLFCVFLLLTGHFPGLSFLALFPLLALQIILALGLGTGLGIVNVFFRDIGHLFGVVLQFWFWLTPIVYPANILPERFQQLLAFNPMTPIINGHQRVLVYGLWPEWHTLWWPALLAVLLCLWTWRLLQRHLADVVDEL